MSPDWLDLATDPVPFLGCLVCLTVATVAVLLLAIQVRLTRATQGLADAAQRHAEAAEEGIELLERLRLQEMHVRGLQAQLTLLVGAQARHPSGPRLS